MNGVDSDGAKGQKEMNRSDVCTAFMKAEILHSSRICISCETLVFAKNNYQLCASSQVQ